MKMKNVGERERQDGRKRKQAKERQSVRKETRDMR